MRRAIPQQPRPRGEAAGAVAPLSKKQAGAGLESGPIST